MKAIRYSAPLLLAVAVALLFLQDATARTRSKTVSGIRLTVSESFDYGGGDYWNGVYVQASQDLEGIAARSQGREKCNWWWETDWDNTIWGFGRNWAAASGSGGYGNDPWDCPLGQILQFNAWGLFRNWTWGPYLNETFGIRWDCNLHEAWCYSYNI